MAIRCRVVGCDIVTVCCVGATICSFIGEGSVMFSMTIFKTF